MRTALVSLYRAYPPVCGAAVVTYNIARHLPGERTLVQLGEKEERIELEHGLTIVTVGRGGAGRILQLAGIFRSASRLAREVGRASPDHVILEGASWALYQLAVRAALRRRGIGVPVIYHAHNVEYDLRARKNGALVARLTRWAEDRLLHKVDAVYAVSGVDASRLAALYGTGAGLLPNGVDTDAFARVSPDAVREAKTRYGLPESSVLFMGLPAYKPNTEALAFLIRDVFPRVVAAVPEARLVVTGGEIALRRDWLLNPGLLDFRGLPAVVKACAVGVAPIFSGSGTRLKILEYMAAGLPVVATAKAAEGLGATSGLNIALAEDGPSFASRITALLRDPASAGRLGTAGRAFVETTSAWPVLIHRFAADLESRRR